MKTFMSVAALCLLASANAEPLPFNAALSISDSSGTARATSLRLDGPEGELSIVVPNGVYTQVDGHAYATALTEGDGTAAAMAEQNGEGHAESDLSAAESTNYIYARAFKDAEEAIAYSDSEGTTHTITESPVGGAVAWTGDGIFEEDGMFDGIIEFPIRDTEMNEGGALASLITAPYPHQAATYSRSNGMSISNAMSQETGTTTSTEQVAVIDVTGTTGLFADALADSSALAEAELYAPGFTEYILGVMMLG